MDTSRKYFLLSPMTFNLSFTGHVLVSPYMLASLFSLLKRRPHGVCSDTHLHQWTLSLYFYFYVLKTGVLVPQATCGWVTGVRYPDWLVPVSFFLLYLSLCVHVHAGVQWQTSGVCLLPWFGSWGSHSAHQVWCQVNLPTILSHLVNPRSIFLPVFSSAFLPSFFFPYSFPSHSLSFIYLSILFLESKMAFFVSFFLTVLFYIN